jgi:hypothetical protein
VNEPVVWIIERDHWPRASLRAELIERGFDAVGFESVVDAVAALTVPGQAQPLVALVDLTTQEAELAGLPEIVSSGCRLVGLQSAVEDSADAARGIPWSAMLRRPVALGALADAIAAVVDGAPAGSDGADQTEVDMVLSVAELQTLCWALDNYLPELRYDEARVKLSRNRHDLVVKEETLSSLRRRLGEALEARRETGI